MPSINTRSASISSASTTSSKSSNDGIRKKFCCMFPACGKSFSRSEHLHRHALNHKDGNNTCLRCSAHFRRRDLLDRHMARHKEKDDEAGGEGLGVLATRKRLWRDADGNIINARRPSYTEGSTQRRQVSRAARKSSRAAAHEEIPLGQLIIPALPLPTTMSRAGSASSTIVVDTGAETYEQKREEQECKFDEQMRDPQDSWLDMNMHSIPSPPITEASLQSDSLQSEEPSPVFSELDALYEESWPPLTHAALPQISGSGPEIETPPLTASVESSPYFGSASWGSSTSAQAEEQPFQTFMGAMAELPYDDIFKSETDMYEWQTWQTQVMNVSRCREEKYDPLEERKLEWGVPYPGQESFRRAFGLGVA